MKSPDQQIYDEVFKISQRLGNDTYSYLPPSGTKYPFVFIGEQIENDVANKSTITGEVTQYIHIYDVKEKRRRVTDIMNDLIRDARKARHTDTYYIYIKEVRKQMLLDTSTSETLWHGVIEVDFKFN